MGNNLLVKWDVLNIGCLSRNRFWGEDESHAHRTAVCTSVLLDAGGVRVLVDPSLAPEAMGALLYTRCGLSVDDIDIVYVTHAHGDHYAGIQAFKNASWRIAPGEAADIPIPDAGEELVPGIRLIHLPGHTDKLCGLIFKSEEGTVVAASDAIMTKDFFEARQGYFNNVNPGETGRSIDKVSKVADIVIPGHDNYFIVKR